MAQLTRAQIQTKITNWITTNGNKEITGAQVNEILTDMIDSGFLQLDEIRTAESILYQLVGTPSDWNGGTAPGTQNLVNDELAQRLKILETNNFSGNIAFVSTTGSDTLGNFELGNLAKPFATITAAWDALPNNDFIILVLGGEYTEEVQLSGKSNFKIDLSGCKLNTINDFQLFNCTDGSVIINGGEIIGNCNFGQSNSNNIKVEGGKILGNLNVPEDSRVEGCIIENSNGVGLSIDNSNLLTTPFIYGCTIISNNSSAVNGVGRFDNCVIEGQSRAYLPPSGVGVNLVSRFMNCSLKSPNTVLLGSGQVLNGVFENCHIESSGSYAMQIGSLNTQYLFFKNCEIISAIDCVFISSTLNRPSGTVTTFKKCSFYTKNPASEIFANNPNASDSGITQLIGTTTVNKALRPLDPPTAGGLQNFEIIGNIETLINYQIPSL